MLYCKSLRYATPPGMKLRWQGMHASHLGSGLHRWVWGTSLCCTKQDTCALPGHACRSWGFQKLGGAPQSFGGLPVLHHHVISNILHVQSLFITCLHFTTNNLHIQ